MEQYCWNTWSDRGFLLNPNPLHSLRGIDTPLSTDITDHIESLGNQLTTLLHSGMIQSTFDQFPVYDMRPMRVLDSQSHVIEYLLMRYGFFASAYVYADPQNPAKKLPAGIAVPLVQLSHFVERPPLLTYASYILANWHVNNPQQGMTVDNMSIIQSFVGGEDEQGFILVHADIEARATEALSGIKTAIHASKTGDMDAVIDGLYHVSASISEMMATFNHMTEKCNVEVYYHHIRPYIFGFNHVVYEGVAEFEGKPQSYRGQSGAQSSIIPALVAGLGLEHEQSALTQHLTVMHDYMPKPHREFITTMTKNNIRAFIMRNRKHADLRAAYNTSLESLLAFRRLHMTIAYSYVAEKVKNPVGTGGTLFMDWLKKLADETESQFA